ncbi:MAG TPA: hypothetical protein VMT18_08340 [Planctomycetota bacterium]|nr:hypothetical protein [Planctomycetota bacterium]
MKLDRKDLALGLLLAVLAFVLYRATFKARQFGDSALLMSIFSAHRDGSGFWYHTLYMPVAGVLGRLLWWASAPEVLRVLSAGCGALGVAFAFLLARAWRASRSASLLAAGLLAVSPGYWFFSTSIEVHTLHAACVGLCAVVAVYAPWQRPLLASLLVAVTLPLLYLSHQSGMLLGPGFVVLSQHARVSCGLARFRIRTLLFGIGPLYLAALIAAIPLSAWMSNRSLAVHLSASRTSVVDFPYEIGLSSAWEGWIQPLGLLLPLAGAGVVACSRNVWALAAPLTFVLPSAAFFLTWGLPERGGYTLGSSMFLAVLASAALSGAARWRVVLGMSLLVLQAAWGYTALRAYDGPEWRETLYDRRDAIRHAIGERGGVISLNTTFQYIEAELPGVIELNLLLELTRAMSNGQPPEAFLAESEPRLMQILGREDLPVLFDRSYADLVRRTAPQALPYSEALERWLEARYQLEPVEGVELPLYRLTGRAADPPR